MNRKIKASFISIGSDIVMIGIKVFLASISGSAALLADAYHSLSDLFVSVSVLTGAASRLYIEKRAAGAAPADAATLPPGHEGETAGEANAPTVSEANEDETEMVRKAPPGY